MTITTKDIRNVVLLAHAGAGKTTLVENLLFAGGAISRKGTIQEGTTVTDYDDEEKIRKSSINLSVAYYEKSNFKVNLLDTPGYLDYIGEIISGINAAESCILLVDAVSGIEVGTGKFWKLAHENKIASIIAISKMDKENANFNSVVESLKSSLAKNSAVLYYPNASGNSFSMVANLLTKEGIDSLKGEDKAKAEKLAREMTELVAESDDALLEQYLEKGELATSDLKRVFRASVISGKIVPIIPLSLEKGIGVAELIQMIHDYMPSPLDFGAPEAVNELFSAQVFKTISDPYAGQISILRVKSGKVVSNQTVLNTSEEQPEKLGQLFYLKGKEQVQTDSAIYGDIVAVAKLKLTATGDTLSDSKKPVKFQETRYPEPAISFSVKPKTRQDEDRISNALAKITAEDVTFQVMRDKQTNELVISGMGDLHLKTIIARMKNRYGVDVEVGTPKVAYKETITVNGNSQYRHKKQTGGAGQFAEVWMRVEPLQRGSGFEFVDEVVGGAIPRQFVGSCEKGVKNALNEGLVAGYPVTDVRVVVYDGKTHPVDSKDIAFQIAAAHAFREACNKAKPMLLEPIMNVELMVPEENMGDITGSLSSRRGRVQGIDVEGGMQVVKAQIPLEEMYKYANELKSITQGRATYTMSFSHYEVVPSNIAQKIILESKKAKKEGE